MKSIRSRLEHLEKDVAHLKYKTILEAGGEAKFKTNDNRIVTINHSQYMELYSQLAQKVFNDKPIKHELLDDIKQASNGIGLYLKAMLGEENKN